jgi:hypothetical protein
MRFEVLMKVNKSILVFWVVTSCGLVGRYIHFVETYYPEDGGSMSLQNPEE